VRAALALAAAAVLLAGCGTPSADLFAVERSGKVPDGKVRMIVDDGGGVTCNGRAGSDMTSAQLLQARNIERDLEPPSKAGLRLEPAGDTVLQYVVHTSKGTLSFADDSRRKPAVLNRLMFFVRQLAQQHCGLAR
jgi:hypothetical protein